MMTTTPHLQEEIGGLYRLPGCGQRQQGFRERQYVGKYLKLGWLGEMVVQQMMRSKLQNRGGSPGNNPGSTPRQRNYDLKS